MPISYSEIKRAAKARLRGRKPSAFLIAAVYLLITCVISLLVYRLTGYTAYIEALYEMYWDVLQNGAQPYLVAYPTVNPLGIVLSAALLLMSLVMTFGFEACCLQFGRGQQVHVRDLFNGFNQFVKVVALLFVRTLIVAVLSLFFVFPGVMAFYRYRTAVFVLMDHPEMGVFACLAETARQTQGHKMEYFLLDLSFIGWWIASYAVSYFAYLPFLDIFVAPYTGTARAIFYDWLNGRVEPAAPDQDEPPVQ